MGSIYDPEGLWFLVRGGTPKKHYRVTAWYPDDSCRNGAAYTFIASTMFLPDGSAVGLRWDPFLTRSGIPDPRGIYRLRLEDLEAGRFVELSFLVWYRGDLQGWMLWSGHFVYGFSRARKRNAVTLAKETHRASIALRSEARRKWARFRHFE
jgi:hypothetical protein